MMFHNPYLHSPYPNYNPYLPRSYYLNQEKAIHSHTKQSFEAIDKTQKQSASTTANSKTHENKFQMQEYIDFLGVRLYFDDILLILLIYFLYTEGVKDIYLFITLILLLLG